VIKKKYSYVVTATERKTPRKLFPFSDQCYICTVIEENELSYNSVLNNWNIRRGETPSLCSREEGTTKTPSQTEIEKRKWKTEHALSSNVNYILPILFPVFPSKT
jgi:hypothetical protein